MFELNQNPDAERRRHSLLLAGAAAETCALDEMVERRSRDLASLGFSALDALHLVCAERAWADVLLTTDDGLLRRARRCLDAIQVPVDNPLHWLNHRNDR